MIPEYVPLAEARSRLSEVVDHIERLHGRVVITKHGRPAAVLLNVDDLLSLEETLEILANPALMADLAEAEQELAAGRTTPLSKEEALQLARRRR